jgi:anti-anti-sigma regulatory factor
VGTGAPERRPGLPRAPEPLEQLTFAFEVDLDPDPDAEPDAEPDADQEPDLPAEHDGGVELSSDGAPRSDRPAPDVPTTSEPAVPAASAVLAEPAVPAQPAEPVQVDVAEAAGLITITVRATDVEADGLRALESAVRGELDTGHRRMVVDLAEVAEWSGSGLAALADLQFRARRANVPLVLVGLRADHRTALRRVAASS